MTEPLIEAIEALRRAAADLEREGAQLRAEQRALGGTAGDGTTRVQVDDSGAVVAVQFEDGAARLAPVRLGSSLLQTYQQAVRAAIERTPGPQVAGASVDDNPASPAPPSLAPVFAALADPTSTPEEIVAASPYDSIPITQPGFDDAVRLQLEALARPRPGLEEEIAAVTGTAASAVTRIAVNAGGGLLEATFTPACHDEDELSLAREVVRVIALARADAERQVSALYEAAGL